MTVSVIGIRNNGTDTTLIKNLSKNSFNYNLSSIPAAIYPNLQLVGYAANQLVKIPPQLKKWQIYYDGVPEVSLNPVKHYSFYKAAVQQGDSVKLSVAIENIGDYTMDSLWFDSWVLDANRNTVHRTSTQVVKLAKPLLIDSIAIANTNFPTTGLPGA